MRARIHGHKGRALLAFATTVVIAWRMRWEAGDLMWGAWASSLTFGWVYGVVLITASPEDADASPGLAQPGRLFGILAVFTCIFGLFHYWQGMVLNTVFRITPSGSWAVLAYPLTALAWYWPVIVTTFFSRLDQLVRATQPSGDPHRLLRPFTNIVRMQILVFVFLMLEAAGLIRFAVYPVLVFYFFPMPVIGEKAKHWFGKLEDRMNTP